MAQVLIDGVSKVYPGNVRAVDDISYHIADKEFVVLVGPSGCGKSTTLRMVAGLEEITEGTITIGDRVVNHVPPKDRDIAMVFQNYALYPHMTVYKNMAFGLKLRKMAKAEIDRRVREAAKLLGIEPLLERKPKALSGGQRQRVAVGRAIVRDPACFLFDEPLSNLDAKLRVETRAELKRLHHRLQTTTIYVTHDQEEAMTLGDRVVVMSEGLIQQAATPLTVYDAPANRFVAGFVGTPPMNFIEGKLVGEEGQIRFEGEGARIVLPDHLAAMVGDRVGQAIVMGLRPEGLYLRPNEHANREDQTVDVTVQVVEPLGSTMDLYCDSSTGQRLVARVKAERLEEQTAATLYIDTAKVHFFEPGDYGLNLTLAEAAAVG
ncbi:MAG: sn-glycerol-3-phosphate ABC transporter ATP-binding protein UgpC [Planctomycetes bacterium]|jgi:multiple sugar transport system ATP-binding protein|nr:sn-glycerol-3-phosphate ABC transporter ATP-binding protein UgpC [Planctomycetota bacterium]